MSLNRRNFLGTAGAAGLGLWASQFSWGQAAAKRPNIVWITAEDLSPILAPYGDTRANTPNLNTMAAEGFVYTNAFANSPVCAPARFTLATGIYPVCCGRAQEMRARGDVPPGVMGYSAYMREAGYYCTNNSKTDYNSNVEMNWHESSKDAHWRNRQPGQPFFAVFNFGQTHESTLRSRSKPSKSTEDIEVPPYLPDTQVVREDIAWIYQRVESLDFSVGRILKQLEEDGLADDTIVFFYGDHGGILPWSKRWLYDRGTQVPFIVRFGKNFSHLAPGKPGEKIERLVSFIDFPPCSMSLCGVQPPEHMQGDIFLGPQTDPEPGALHFNRGRMDERHDLVRAVRDKEFLYIRNFWPFIPHGLRMKTPWQIPTTQEWQRLHDEGKLNELQERFFQTRPFEELYEVKKDPHQIYNLADNADYAEILEKMRKRADAFALRVVDTGYHRSGVGEWGWVAQREPGAYPLERILDTAKLGAGATVKDLPEIINRLDDPDPDVRFWAACGCRTLEGKSKPAEAKLKERLDDPGLWTQVVAAEALYVMGEKEIGLKGLAKHAGDPMSEACLWALNAVDRSGAADALQKEIAHTLEVAQSRRDTPHNHYVKRLAGWLTRKAD